MPGIGESVHEHAHLGRSLGQHVPDTVRHDRGRHREIGAGQPLGERDDIGTQAIGARPEPLPGAPESGDHLVGDHQDVMLVEQRLHLFEIGRGRDEHAARAHHRFGDEGGDAVGPFPRDDVLQLCHQSVREGRFILARFGEGVVMGAFSMNHALDRQVESRVVGGNTREAARGQRQPVIGPLAGDDLFLGGLAAQVVVVAHQLEGGVIGVGPGGAEEDPRHVRTRNGFAKQRQQAVGQADRGFCRRTAEEVLEAQRLHCLGGGLGQFLAAVARVHTPQARAHVDQALPGVTSHFDALGAAIDHGAVYLDIVDGGDGVKQAGTVEIGKRQVDTVVHRGGPCEGGKRSAGAGAPVASDCAQPAGKARQRQGGHWAGHRTHPDQIA